MAHGLGESVGARPGFRIRAVHGGRGGAPLALQLEGPLPAQRQWILLPRRPAGDGAAADLAPFTQGELLIENADGQWSLQTAAGEHTLCESATALLLEDFSGQAAVVIPPRTPRLKTRLFWRVLLALAPTPAGRRWLDRRSGAA
jgi:hypothetical protein